MVAVKDQPIDKEAFEAKLMEEIAKIRQMMLDEWGHAPELEIEVETALIVRANFNIKGFAHKGQQVIIKEGTIKRGRKPALVARKLCREITEHRNTCADCGDGLASLFYRARGSGYDWGKDLPPEGFMVGHDYDPVTRTTKKHLLMLDVLPDKVEHYLNPQKSKQAKLRIEALPPERRQTVVCKNKMG